MAEYICECGKPAVIFIRRLEEDGSPPAMWSPNDKSFAACARHVNRALRFVFNGQRAATMRLMLVRSRTVGLNPPQGDHGRVGTRIGH